LKDDYLTLSQLEIIPGRFVNYFDFTAYNISSYLLQTGLHGMFSFDSRKGYYPSLIYLFYTNLNYEDNDDNVMLSILLKAVEIRMTPRSLGRILHISSHGLTLSEIEMNNDEVFSRIYLPGQGPLMTNNKLQPISQLIGCILAYNICLKTDSYNYYSHDLATLSMPSWLD